jgi:hypothetical protein
MFKGLVGHLLRLVASDYWNGWVYLFTPTPTPLANTRIHCAPISDLDIILESPHEELRKQGHDLGSYAWPFGAWMGNELAAICWFQARDTYRGHGGLLLLADNDAELTQITTAHVFRGQRIAPDLIRYGSWCMGRSGYTRLYAKIWHDNVASIKAFESAGWMRESRLLSVTLQYWKRPLTIRRNRPVLT